MRPLRAAIRLDRLRENYQTLKRLHGGKMLAVLKADAYGHGAVRCAHALADLADGFAVAFLEEAVELRKQGITQPIVLLEGVFDAAEYAAVDEYGLWPVVADQWQLDSGMHRAGCFPHNYASAYTALAQSGKVSDIVKISHFACADEEERGMTEMQLEAFDMGCAGLAGEESLANSAAMLAYPQARRDWGRAGLALYGIDPFLENDPRIKPVMRLVSRVFAERVLQPHEPIGYGASFYTKRSTRVGLAACGYADGYPRRAATGTPVAVNGRRSRILGRVSMDMLTVELADTHEGVGSEVELWGDTVSINEVAAAAGTIAYELLCNVKRAKFVYIQ